MMPLQTIDVVGLSLWIVLWLFYLWFAEFKGKNRPNLATGMQGYRRAWMKQAFHRDNRALDAILVGNLMHTCTFFTSTTLLIVGGLFAWGGAKDSGAEVLQALPFAKRDSLLLFEFKIMAIAGVMTYALLRFTWAIRQFNLVSILIGAYRGDGHTVATDQLSNEDSLMVERAARLNELAGTNFTQALRAYYFAVPLLLWLVNPWMLIVGSVIITLATYYMEFRSATIRALSATTIETLGQ